RRISSCAWPGISASAMRTTVGASPKGLGLIWPRRRRYRRSSPGLPAEARDAALLCSAASFPRKVEIHTVCRWLQVVALDVIDPGLPERGHHGGAADIRHYRQLALVMQRGDHFPELFHHLRGRQVLAESIVDLHVIDRQMPEYRVGIER